MALAFDCALTDKGRKWCEGKGVGELGSNTLNSLVCLMMLLAFWCCSDACL